MGGPDLSDLWLEGDDGLGPPTLAEELIGAPRPRKGIVICSLDFCARIRRVVWTSTHLVIAMLIYSKCLERRGRTVSLSNRELRLLGISRYAKYRTLTWLQEVGVITIEETVNGQSTRVTLLPSWFP
jgi:hypothetical protein